MSGGWTTRRCDMEGWMGRREEGWMDGGVALSLACSLARPPAAVRSPSSTQKSAGIPLAPSPGPPAFPPSRPPDHDGEAKLDLTALFRRRSVGRSVARARAAKALSHSFQRFQHALMDHDGRRRRRETNAAAPSARHDTSMSLWLASQVSLRSHPASLPLVSCIIHAEE